MRSLNSRALALGIATIAASSASGDVGCSSTKPTEMVPGALTQVQVPGDLAGIQVEVTANGAQKFCQGYQVSNGSVELPSTLGVLQGQANTTLRITLRGYDTATSNDLFNCNGLSVDQADAGAQGAPPRVLRQAIVTYVDQETLFLPMPLSFSCYDTDCSSQGTDSTCKGGQCKDGNIDSSTLAQFTPSLVDGTGDCFDVNECFPAGASATLVDAASCTYEVPAALQAQGGTGLSVRVFYQENTWTPDPGTGIYAVANGVPTEQEILSEDPDEGFTIPDSTKPQQFALAPGLCNLATRQTTPPTPPATGTKSFVTIGDVQVATSCPPKLPLLPFCAGQQHNNVTSSTTPQDACGTAIPLEPTPNAVYLVMDNSGAMEGAFGEHGNATAINLAFQNPAFRRTYVAFRFLDHSPLECPGSSAADGGSETEYTTPAVAFGLAGAVEPQVAPLLTGWTPPDSPGTPLPLYLQAAMQPQGAYQYVSQFASKLAGDGGASGALNVAAVMFFVNRTPVATPPSGSDAGSDYPTSALDCTPPTGSTVQGNLAAEAQAAAKTGVQTYFVVLNDQEGTPQPQLDFYNGVASALGEDGGAGSAVTVLDATSTSPEQVLQKFLRNNFAAAATCVFDTPPGIDTTAQLSFTIPPQTLGLNATDIPLPITVAQLSSCEASTATVGDGWNIESGTGRIRLCGQACSDLQATIAAVALGALEKTSGDGGADAGLPSGDGGASAVPDVPVTVTKTCGDSGAP